MYNTPWSVSFVRSTTIHHSFTIIWTHAYAWWPEFKLHFIIGITKINFYKNDLLVALSFERHSISDTLMLLWKKIWEIVLSCITIQIENKEFSCTLPGLQISDVIRAIHGFTWSLFTVPGPTFALLAWKLETIIVSGRTTTTCLMILDSKSWYRI